MEELGFLLKLLLSGLAFLGGWRWGKYYEDGKLKEDGQEVQKAAVQGEL